jgi:purine-nucleoside phosphorylase
VGIDLARGTYAAVLGPAYETAAEVRMLGRLGADLVGMSTVPDVIAARALGIRCVGLSVVTNKATGLGAGPIAHADVLEIGKKAGRRLAHVIIALLKELAALPQSTTTK